MEKEYLTIKEFSEAAKITQQAIYKSLNTKLKDFVLYKDNKKFINAAALSLYTNIKNKDIEVKQPENEVEQPENEVEQPENEVEQPERAKNSTYSTENSTYSTSYVGKVKQPENEVEQPEREIELLNKTIEILKDQLIGKDKQIEALNDRLAEITKALNNQQQLNLLDKKDTINQITDISNNDEAKEKKIIGFIDWLLKRY